MTDDQTKSDPDPAMVEATRDARGDPDHLAHGTVDMLESNQGRTDIADWPEADTPDSDATPIDEADASTDVS